MHRAAQTFLHLLLLLNITCSSRAHNLGAHGLAGTDPPNTPNIPEITGPFSVTVSARYHNVAGRSWQAIFAFGNGVVTDGIVLVQVGTSSTMRLIVYIANVSYHVDAPNTIVQGVLQTWKCGVDTSGALWVQLDGDTNIYRNEVGITPNNVVRSNKRLGASDWYTTVDDLEGLVSDIRIRNLLTTNANAKTLLKELDFVNLPGQLYGPFTVSFYARFDANDTTSKVFCFADENLGNAVVFGRDGSSQNAVLRITQGGSTNMYEGSNLIQTGEMAFWHVSVDSSGTPSVLKNGMSAALHTLTTGFSATPGIIFRKFNFIGEGCSSERLDGVVLGLRVDIDRVS